MDTRSIDTFSGPDNPVNGTIPGSVLVLGASDEIGRGVVRSLLEAGRPVVAVDADRAGLASLRSEVDAHEEFFALPGSVENENDGLILAQSISRLKRPPTAVVALLGGQLLPGRLLDHPAHHLREKLDKDLCPHLIAARHLLPVLAATGRPATYLIVGGPAAESPWAGYGHLSVSAAALRSMTHVLNTEMQSTAVRVRQLSVCSPIRTESNREHACPDWPNVYEVGHRIAELLATPPQQPVAYLERQCRRVERAARQQPISK